MYDAEVVVAYIVVAHIGMAHIVMAYVDPNKSVGGHVYDAEAMSLIAAYESLWLLRHIKHVGCVCDAMHPCAHSPERTRTCCARSCMRYAYSMIDLAR